VSVNDVWEALARVETALDDAYHELTKLGVAPAPDPTQDVAEDPVGALTDNGDQPGDETADPTETADQSAPSAPSYNPGAAEDTGA